MRYAADLADAAARGALPPVASWRPAYCGEIDIVIRSDGVWVHEGTPIGRARLVRLFSTVLRREGDRYFLVTPAEKVGIRVEDAPFVAVLMREEEHADGRRLVFTTNVGDEAAAGPEHALEVRPFRSDRAPYLHIRDGLWARLARPVFYDLVAHGNTRGETFGVESAGAWFPFGDAAEIFRDA